MAKNTSHTKLASNARVRRAEHLIRDAKIKARKHGRPTAGERARARIRAAKLEHERKTAARPVISRHTSGMVLTSSSIEDHIPERLVGDAATVGFAQGPFTVGKKSPQGWPVVDATKTTVAYESSRTKARELAKAATAGDVQIEGVS